VLRLSRTTRSRVVLLLILAFSTRVRAASDFLSLDIFWSSHLNSPPLVPLAIDDERVYLSLRGGTLRALALGNGREVWTIDLPLSTALSASDGAVFGATARELVAIDGPTGRIRWRVPLPELSVAPVSRAGWVIVGSGADLLAFRAADGSILWRVPLGAPLQAAVTIEGDRVYASLDDGSVVAVEITSGALAWRANLPAPGGAVTAIGDRLYLGAADKFFYALDAKDGGRDWRWRAAAAILAPVAVDEWRVYYTALDNVVRAVDVGSGVQKWRYVMETRPLAGPVLDDDLLIVAASGDLRAVRVADGSLVGKWGAPAELASAPVFAPPARKPGAAHLVVVTGAATGDWRVYGLARSPEPKPQPLKEIPGRPLSPDVLPAPPGPPTTGGRFLP
jgi:outer membrane protein assembly factor BamB